MWYFSGFAFKNETQTQTLTQETKKDVKRETLYGRAVLQRPLLNTQGLGFAF